MTEGKGLFVFGASGHGRVVIDAIERGGTRAVVFLCDDAKEKHGGHMLGYTVIGGRDALLSRRSETSGGVVAIGDNALRMAVAAWLDAQGLPLVDVIHPAATRGRDVTVGAGTVVMAGCVLNTGARVGRNVIVNTAATVDHDCEIADGVHIGPGSHLCGHVSVGTGTLIGAGTTVVPGIRIGSGATVGAGSTVLRDVPDGARVGGSPCRTLVS